MADTDYYDIIGVGRDATPEEIKKAYRKRAKQYHPDHNPNDKTAERKFKELSEAHDVLKNKESRQAYDQFGHAAFQNGGFQGGGQNYQSRGGFGNEFSSSMSDVFSELFKNAGGFSQQDGPRRRAQGKVRGSDLRYNLEISLKNAWQGKKINLRIPSSVACAPCKGTGAKPGTKASVCATCKGAGAVQAQQGFFMVEHSCPTCQGVGETIKDPCTACHGKGRVQKERTLTIEIPRGVENGEKLHLVGEGEAGFRGGPSGDLYIFVSVTPDSFFIRKGANLYCTVQVPITVLCLGGSIQLPILDGKKIKVTIPTGFQPNKKLRVRGKGMPILSTKNHGDILLQVEAEIPKDITPEQKKLLQELTKQSEDKNFPESAKFTPQAKV